MWSRGAYVVDSSHIWNLIVHIFYAPKIHGQQKTWARSRMYENRSQKNVKDPVFTGFHRIPPHCHRCDGPKLCSVHVAHDLRWNSPVSHSKGAGKNQGSLCDISGWSKVVVPQMTMAWIPQNHDKLYITGSYPMFFFEVPLFWRTTLCWSQTTFTNCANGLPLASLPVPRHWSWKCSHPGAPMVSEPSMENRQRSGCWVLVGGWEMLGVITFSSLAIFFHTTLAAFGCFQF